MRRKKLLSISLAALLAATMPSTVWASEEIEIEYSDVELTEESQDEELQGEELQDEELELSDKNIEIENNDEQLIDIDNTDIDLFTSEDSITEYVGTTETKPSVTTYLDATTLQSGTEIARGVDNVINLGCTLIGRNITDIRTDDDFIIKADIYIDNNKVNENAVILDKTNLKQAKGTYTLSKEVLAQYPEGETVTVQYYSDFDSSNVKTMKKKSFKIYTPVAANPTVEEIYPWGMSFEFERGEECSGAIAVKLSDRTVEGKDPYCAVYINGQRKTEPVALQRNTNVDPDKGYRGDISIAPELTEYLPEGTKIQIKVGFGSEMEDVSDEKVLEIEATGKPFIQGAKVDEIRSYNDAEYEKSLGFVRAGRDYTAYLKGTFRDVTETDPLEVYAGVYVNNNLLGELQPMTVEADNSAYSGKITFSLPEDTPASTAGRVVSIKVGIGKDMDNCAVIGKVSREKFDLKEVKTSKVEILDVYQEEEQFDRKDSFGFIVNLKMEGIPGDFYDMHSEVWLGNQLLKDGIGATSGFRVDFTKEYREKIKDYEGSYLTIKLVDDEDNVDIFSYDMPLVGLTTKEEETASTVADQLKDLPAVDKITLEDKESVKAARDAYDALNEDQKKLVPEEQVKALTEVETKIAELQKAADKKAADEKAAKAVTDQIAAIPAVNNLKLTDASKVKAARDAYNKLSADQKKLITAAQLKVLTDAEARITQLQKAAQVKPKITLNVTSLPIQVKKSTAGIRIKTTAIKGDKIKSAKSSNSKVVKVSVKNGKLTVKGLKAGKATVTVTSTKGAKATVKITVQKQKVATKKLKATVSTKQILKKGKKVTLKVAKTPFTAQDSVKWTSSNKKIATVTSKGVVKGLKKGTATITAKAGKKVVKIKVTVK